MNTFASDALFLSPLTPTNNKVETISLRGVEWTPIGSKIRREPNLYGRDFYYYGDRSLGTDEGDVPVMPRRDIEQDTFLDNKIGAAMRSAKAKFGKAPFIEAYKRVLNTSKKLDEEWDEYWEEEDCMRSFFKEGED